MNDVRIDLKPRAFITPSDAAKRYGVSVDSIERACRRSELPAIKIGRQWRIPVDGLIEFEAKSHSNVVTEAYESDVPDYLDD